MRQGQSLIGVRLLVLVCLFLMVACQSHDPFGCFELIENASYEEAAIVCANAFEQTENHEYAVKSAESSYELKDIDQLVLWTKRLSGTESEMGLWSQLGQLLNQQGEYQKADSAYERDYELFHKAGIHSGASAGLYWRGYIAWETARYKEALEFASAAFDNAQLAEDRKLEVRALYLLSSIFQDLGYYDSAEQVLGFIKDRIASENTSSQIYFLINQGTLRMHQQRMSLARDSLEKSLALVRTDENLRTVRSIYLNLIEVNLSLGNVDAAAELMDKAWSFIEPGGRVQTPILFNQAQIFFAQGKYRDALDVFRGALEREDIAPIWEWQIHNGIGQIAKQLDDEKLLTGSYKSAIAMLEDFHESLLINELKSAYSNKKRQPYEALFGYYAASNNVLEAFDIVERAKARTFLDAYVHAINELPAVQSIPDAINEAPERFNSLSKVLPAMNASPVASPKGTVTALEQLGNRNVFTYFEAESELWLLSVISGEVKLSHLHSDIIGLKKLIADFSDDPNNKAYAMALGEVLLPNEIMPALGARIYIVPDSVVGRLPFSALINNGKYFIEDYIISYVPSINGLLAIEEGNNSQIFGSSLVMGDPLGNLPSARIEAQEVAKALNVNAFVGNDASSQVLMGNAGASVLHLATHSGLNANGSWFSLADTEVNSATVLSSKIAPRLVTLASCASASRNDGELWGSLGAAFLIAGSKAVLASLWTVDDDKTRIFMSGFYANDVIDDPAVAIAEAQRQFILNNERPSMWSAFILLGSNRAYHLGENEYE